MVECQLDIGICWCQFNKRAQDVGVTYGSSGRELEDFLLNRTSTMQAIATVLAPAKLLDGDGEGGGVDFPPRKIDLWIGTASLSLHSTRRKQERHVSIGPEGLCNSLVNIHQREGVPDNAKMTPKACCEEKVRMVCYRPADTVGVFKFEKVPDLGVGGMEIQKVSVGR